MGISVCGMHSDSPILENILQYRINLFPPINACEISFTQNNSYG